VLVANVEVEIVVSLKAKVADGAHERLVIDVGFKMRLDVRLGWESFAAYVTIERFRVLMKSFMETPQSLHFKVFWAVTALEWAINRVRNEMASQVLLGLEAFLACGALEVERVTVCCLVSDHVGFLNERLATNIALVIFLARVKLHVAIQRKLLGEILVAYFTQMRVVFWL
jgi:hypothetical protein